LPDKLKIVGGHPLSGQIPISGAKNAALPALAASLLTDETIQLSNLPDVWDTGTMRRLLEGLGVRVTRDSTTSWRLSIDSDEAFEAPYRWVKTMRASILTLGPLLAKRRRARVSLPGGCAIGSRPIDLHLAGLSALGARIDLAHGFVEAAVDGRLRGAPYHFERITVTGTENLMLAACLADGYTRLTGCAREPEIQDLADLLNAMGADIEGAGTECIEIRGVTSLGSATHRVIPDRIEAGTFAIAAALIADDAGLELTGCKGVRLEALREVLSPSDVAWDDSGDNLRVGRAETHRPLSVKTAPFPGFATDLQAQLMVLASQGRGVSHIEETIFENRFMHVAELVRMGAHIDLTGGMARVHGPTPLSGAATMATDLRASACLVLAGLIAEGETSVDRIYHLDRGYQRIEQKLRSVGARIERIEA